MEGLNSKNKNKLFIFPKNHSNEFCFLMFQRENGEDKLTLDTKHWSWKRSFTSTDISPGGDVSRSRTPFA